MFTGIDHVMIAVADLPSGIAQFRRLGFAMQPGGRHPGRGTWNAVACNDGDYLELIAVEDAQVYAATGASGRPNTGLTDFVAAGGGIRYLAIRSDDLAGDVAAMRIRGVDVSDPVEGSRETPEGQALRWKTARLGAGNALPLFFIEHLTPPPVAAEPGHPNRVQRLERAYIVVNDAAAASLLYAKVLGMAVPALQKGTVIMSHMAIFDIGRTGLGVVQPYAPGPAAEALARRGEGPFQALYRTAGMEAAAAWMSAQGLAPLARGVRNTGEQAMLATPAEACGAYIGFVGPA
jgi:catechol 2,3-dioxygenase-like lactoylglutathione lyase family enzyme